MDRIDKRDYILIAALIAIMILMPFRFQMAPNRAEEPREVETVQPAPPPAPEEPPPAVEAVPLELRTPHEILTAQVVDKTHDAFLVHTRGRMGTLLVTAEWEMKGEIGYSNYRVWRLDDLETPMQEFSSETLAFGIHQAVDANFDGAEDFGWECSEGTSAWFWLYWLWDEEQGQFVYSDALTWISMPVFHRESQLVSSWRGYGYAGGQIFWYRWEGDRLSLLRSARLDSANYWSTQRKLTVSIGVNGYPVQIYQELFPGDDAGIDASWEVWGKWKNLDYFDGREALCDLLAQQTVDEDHDAFLIDTGGEMGTLLVTAERREGEAEADAAARLVFSVWDPADLSAPIQTMEADSDYFRQAMLLDINFDGYLDFLYYTSESSNGNPGISQHYNAWIWDEMRGEFKEVPGFDALVNPTPIPEEKRIACYRNIMEYEDVYSWSDGELIRVED